MDQSNENPRPSSKAALLCVLYCLSAEVSASRLQHRVRSSQRQVPYQHTLQNTPRSSHDPFGRSDSTGSYVQPPELTLHHEQLDDASTQWVYSADTATVRRSADPTLDRKSKQSSAGGYLKRFLYDQFVGEESVGDNDEVNQNQTNVTTEVDVNSTYFNETGESSVVTKANETNATIFRPLRIRAILGEDSDFLDVEERESLFHDMLSPALLSWSSALRVDPVVGNLTVDSKQLSPGNVCGPGDSLPSVAVPLSHLSEGIPDTDIIVYISLGFVSQRNKTVTPLNRNGTNETDLLETEEPVNGTEPLKRRLLDELDDSLEVLPIMNNTNSSSSSFSCSDDYLAAASYCSTDQYDRPTAALLHICIDDGFFDHSKVNRNARTIMHELGHALGFNALSMAHFRRPDGTPITPRVNGDVPDTKIECTGPGSNHTFATVALPSEEILRFRKVRRGVRVAEVVTPSVLQVVRNHFDCQELQGAELESGEGLALEMQTEGYGCIGDHWERRLFSTDLMNPVVDKYDSSPRISTLTLAYFADSGWYQVDLNYARVAAGWGRGSGCNFVNDTCIVDHGLIPPKNAPFFCNEVPSPQLSRAMASDIHGCTPDLSRKATCSIGQYDHELPPQFQYFNDTYGANVGGKDPFLDYCPVYNGYANGLCSDISNERIMKSSRIETFGTRNSRCLIGDVGNSHKMALCLPIACVVDDQTFRIRIEDQWHECSEEGQIIQSGLTTIFCPNPQRICPTFYCPFDCLGTGGVCDYASGKCLCEYPTMDDDVATFLAECGSVQTEMEANEDDPRPVLHFPIIRPNITVNAPLDSPYIDYYVPDQKSLEEKPPKARWALFLSIGIGFAAMILLAGVLLFMRGNDDDGDDGRIERNFRLNKDKMVATVLVDLRMQEAGARDASVAETDEHLTESVASRPPSDTFSDIGRYSEVMSDLEDAGSDGMPLTPPRPTTTTTDEGFSAADKVIRRRKIGFT